MASPAEFAAMRRAVELAARGRSTTLPNPVVGCVVLGPEAVTVGEGWHERAGGPHAEIVALAAAGPLAEGATAVVTLEPCAHQGRSGPCVDALLGAGIRRVVVAVRDPNPAAAGGLSQLAAAGVEVEDGVLAAEAEAVNEPWLTAMRRQRPFVTWKYAASLDGRVAAADGSSRWITGPEARADTHRLRGECDTIMVGVGTVLADDPHLTVRTPEGGLAGRQLLRVVVDSDGRTPADARVCDDAAPTWVATAAEVGRGVGGVDLREVLTRLFDRERRHVLLEGGPRLAGSFIRQGLVDRVVGYVAPTVLGAGPAALGEAGVTSITQAYRLEIQDIDRVGADLRLTARPIPTPPPRGSDA